MDSVELLPRDKPGCLDSFFSHSVVAYDRQADPTHVLVVRRDDATEGELITGSSGR